jgi:hypothetical protein
MEKKKEKRRLPFVLGLGDYNERKLMLLVCAPTLGGNDEKSPSRLAVCP